jgi:hypothetical protein
MSSKTSLLVWHYAGHSKYEMIKAFAELRAKKVPWYSKRKPVIWFTASQEIDPVVKASLAGLDRLRPVVRIGMTVGENVLPFDRACDAAGFTPESRRRAERKAESHGASIKDWYAVVADHVTLQACVIEFFDEERGVWVSVRPDLTEFPETDSPTGGARWAARLGLLCEKDFFDYAISGKLSYAMKQYALGYAAGDGAYWDWGVGLDPEPDELLHDRYFRLGFLDRIAHLVGLLQPQWPLHMKAD